MNYIKKEIIVLECGICLRPEICPTDALYQQELDSVTELMVDKIFYFL
jgi:formate hydrogenlyase subunit 6/NADH:ubiquinone oxidoreductase subunit I